MMIERGPLEDVDASLAAAPIDFFADLLRELADDGELLAAFCDIVDHASYDPSKPLNHGVMSYMVLTAIDELQMYDSDPGEVLRCLRDGLRLKIAGVDSPIPMRERLAALRPEEQD